jgi:hypothetical protein
MEKKIALVYLGRRGGGARLLRDLSHMWISTNPKLTCLVRDECEFIDELEGKVLPHFLPKRTWLLFVPWIKNASCKRIARSIVKLKIDYAIFIMSHPWTPYLLKELRKSKVKTFVFIHDDRAHKGERWPTKRHLEKEISFADSPVFLSHYVASQFPEIPHPLIFSLDSLPLVAQEKKIKRVLVPGRIRKYKGLDKVFPYLSAVPSDYKILVAGQGHINIPSSQTGRVELLNEWIPAKVFETLIMESSHVLLPYLEATQSGIVAIAKLYNCHILIKNKT